MELADKIYRLRTEKKFSQGDLADALEVSRQSVSKWETGASVPELDKLVKLSELFGVTLDELVRDAAPEPQKPEPNCSDKGERVVVLHAVPVRKLVGTIILAVGGLLGLLIAVFGNVLSGLLFFLPFLTCGLTCFLFRRRIALWCLWQIDIYWDICVGLHSSIGRASVFSPYFYDHGIDWGVIWSWVLLLGLIGLVVWTFFSFRGLRLELSSKQKILFCAGWGVFVILYILSWIPGIGVLSMESWHSLSLLGLQTQVSFLYALFEWIRISLFTVLLVVTAGVIRKKREEKRARAVA